LKSRKRSLPFSSAIGGTGEADARDLELIDMAEAATRPKKTNNDLWNDLHCDLVRELEKKGTLSRYSVRHLKLWTDYILEGKSAGVGDEQKWEDHIDLVGVPPLKRKEKENSVSPNTSSSADQLLRTMIIQNQHNTQLFQTSLLAILANQQSPTIKVRN